MLDEKQIVTRKLSPYNNKIAKKSLKNVDFFYSFLLEI